MATSKNRNKGDGRIRPHASIMDDNLPPARKAHTENTTTQPPSIIYQKKYKTRLLSSTKSPKNIHKS
jgi:hypothetical protein